MAYEPTTWQSGDVVTSAKLNKLENGVAGLIFATAITIDEDSITLGNTWQEIHDALAAGKFVVGNVLDDSAPENMLMLHTFVEENTYYVEAFRVLDDPLRVLFRSSSADGYPACEDVG